MFGKNPIALIDNETDGRELRVVNVWRTVQGEGPFTGHPATFIRLHGCNLRCTFCDTQFSDPDDPYLDIQKLALQCADNGYRLVVLTGGEPLRQNILPLCTLLDRSEFLVQIETAGTLWIEGLQDVSRIICSPKTPVIHPKVKEHAFAFKYVISTEDTHDGYLPITATQPGAKPRRLAEPRDEAPVYLSPRDDYDEAKNEANRWLVGMLAMEHNVIAGIQLHKFLKLD